MQESWASTAEAVESRHREFQFRVMVDWANDGRFAHVLSNMTDYVVSAKTDQALESTAPSELMLVEGHAAAQLTLEMAGEYNNYPLVGHFSPYNARSVFYGSGLQMGVAVEYFIGAVGEEGTQWFKQFTGRVREVSADRATGIATIDCLDAAENMRIPVEIPAYGIPVEPLQQGHKRGALVDSSSLIDLAARTTGYFKGPHTQVHGGPDVNVILNVPLHGSLLPEIGMLGDPLKYHITEQWERQGLDRRRTDMYTRGPWGQLCLNGVPPGNTSQLEKTYYPDNSKTPEVMHAFGSWGMSCWVYIATSEDDELNNASGTVLQQRVSSFDLRLVVNGRTKLINAHIQSRNEGSTLYTATAQPLQTGWNFVEARFEISNTHLGAIARVGMNNFDVPTETLWDSGELSQGGRPNFNTFKVFNRFPMTDVLLIYSGWSDWGQFVKAEGPRVFTDNASISDGRNRLMYTKRETYESAWDLVKDVAAAEYGVVYFDEHGRFHFKNFQDVQGWQGTPPVRSFSLDEVEGLSLRTTMDSVRNVWSIETRTADTKYTTVFDPQHDGFPVVPTRYQTSKDKDGNATALAWTTDGIDKSVFNPSPFVVGAGKWEHFWVPIKPEVVFFNPDPAPTTPAWNTEWDFDQPLNAKKIFRTGVSSPEDAFLGWTLLPSIAFEGRRYVMMSMHNQATYPVEFYLHSKNQWRFRLGGRLIEESEPEQWEVTTTDVAAMNDETSHEYARSIDLYGRRVLSMDGNKWLQDKFQTREMLKRVISKFGRPIPVTDDITVPGDPRIQLGDVIRISDPDGMGGDLQLQVLGIQREANPATGLTDTYSVEFIEPPGQWQLGHDEYSRLGESTILG